MNDNLKNTKISKSRSQFDQKKENLRRVKKCSKSKSLNQSKKVRKNKKSVNQVNIYLEPKTRGGEFKEKNKTQ